MNIRWLIPVALLLFYSCEKDKRTLPVKTITREEALRQAEAARRADVVAYAKTYLGTRYCYSGSNPKTGFDCSGFVNFVFAKFGIDLPRSSSGFTTLGTPLRPEEFRVGDILVFYGYRDSNAVGHVGIICEASGMQSKFIHASSGSEMAVTISELGSEMYTRRFYKCIDPFRL